MSWLQTYFTKMAGGGALPQAPRPTSAFLAGSGATAGLSDVTGAAFLMAPFGASCFLAFALPGSPLAQPRNIIFGHLISTAVGLTVLALLGNGLIAVAIAVGLAAVLMQLTRTGHAPAGADPLVVFAVQPAWSYLLFPVLTGAIVIALTALLFNNLRPGIRYPKYW